MRLGYLVPEFPSQTHAFFWREVNALRDLGLEVRLLSTRAPRPDACRHAFAARARAETRYLYPPTLASALAAPSAVKRAPNVLGYLAGLSRASIKEYGKRAGLAACGLELLSVCRELELDHVHIHSAADAAHLGALCRAWGGPPYSLTLHGDLEVYGKDHARKMQGAQFVAAVTRPLQQQILSATSLSKAVVPVIWMGVDTERFAPTSLDFRGPLKLLTVARLNRQKGHTFALQAIRRCLDEGLEVSYTIVGSGEHRGSIEEEIARLGLEGAVRLMGTLSEDEVLAALQDCHVFVLPSVGLGEAAPVSVMEAMACGRAVVCSRIGGTTDMIRDGVDGRIVEQGDVEGLVQAFKQLGQQPEFAEQLGETARQTALSLFDHRALAQRLALAISGEPARASL